MKRRTTVGALMTALSLVMILASPVAAVTFTAPYSDGTYNYWWPWSSAYVNLASGRLGARGNVLGGDGLGYAWLGSRITLTTTKTLSISVSSTLDAYVGSEAVIVGGGAGIDVVIIVRNVYQHLSPVYQKNIFSWWEWWYTVPGCRTFSNWPVTGSGQVQLSPGTYIVSVELEARTLVHYSWVNFPGDAWQCTRLIVHSIGVQLS